jgi:hypothetical protein
MSENERADGRNVIAKAYDKKCRELRGKFAKTNYEEE